MPTISVTTCYRFLPLDASRLTTLQSELESFARTTGLRGLCLIGTEGVNLTVSGEADVIARFKNFLASQLADEQLTFKDAFAAKHPFSTFKVKEKPEIVTLGRPDLDPGAAGGGHLSPQEWHEALQDPETIVIDTRNDYEVDIGRFRGAIDFRLKEFAEFPEAVRNADLDKNKKVLMYCTGGIRCEKAYLAMREQGFEHVHQLNGGILNYLKDFPEQAFEGECFVFDYRVAVDQKLEPSRTYVLCPHCGQPAREKISCVKCDTSAVICTSCAEKNIRACSKNCAHHVAIGSRSSKPHQAELALRHRAPASPRKA